MTSYDKYQPSSPEMYHDGNKITLENYAETYFFFLEFQSFRLMIIEIY